MNDVSQLNPDANLGDLGLDSLMGVEIKQALERDYDIVLSMKDIRTLTLNKLQQLAENGGQGNTTLQTTELDIRKVGILRIRANERIGIIPGRRSRSRTEHRGAAGEADESAVQDASRRERSRPARRRPQNQQSQRGADDVLRALD